MIKENDINHATSRWKGFLSFLGLGMLLLALNIILMAILNNELIVPKARFIGYFLCLAAVLMWVLAVVELNRHSIKKGRNYMLTTKVVDTGIFSLVRHPQYFADILFNVGIIFVVQHWIVLIIGLLSCIFLYLGMKDEEQILIKAFGDEYRECMKKVPRVNIFKSVFFKAKIG